jgi:protein O-GlcNAc transferase
MNINNAVKSAMDYYQAGRWEQAVNTCKKIVKIQPNNINALHLLGILSYQQKDYEAAITYSKILINLTPGNAQAHYIIGHSMQERGEIDEAITYYQRSIQLNPNFTDAYYNLGTIFQDQKKYDEAISSYQKALQLNPADFDAYYNLARTLQEKEHYDEAITYYRKALQLNPNLADAYNNIGTILQKKEQLDEAITYFQKALQLNPNLADAYNNIGTILQKKEQLDEAITYFQKALQLNPNLADVYNNIGTIFQEQERFDEAIDYLQKALQCNPDLTVAYSQLTLLMQQICNWQELEALTTKLDVFTKKALDSGSKPAETPFMSITRNANPSINFAIAKAWSHDIVKALPDLRVRFPINVKTTHKTKIVIGYLSSDFRNHATAHLMLSLFGCHNRESFEIFCYSYGKDDGSHYRAQIEHDCNKFVDISGLSYAAAAKSIREDQVDILVDLKGYTRGSRLPICALRPAPIQVSYLGFPGTTGADFIDYIITDKIVTPKNQCPFYSEKFVYMPHCYQVNDHTQAISNKEWRKTDFGLPETCFLFCSFNQPYKIDPVMFDIWMRILHQVPEGVMWLGCSGKIIEENLRRQAEARGIQPERIFFAEKLTKDKHLARLRLADLALDTQVYNGHTTTSDALWAGVPVVTLQGSHFASRVSSSILSALGMSELITYSIEEYEALAVRLAFNILELKEMRLRIARNRMAAPLFDTPRFVKNLETAYKKMWKIFLTGAAPREIEVLET